MRDSEWSQLMRAAMNGDDGSYRSFLTDVSRALRAIVRRGLGATDIAGSDAEDVVQEVILAIHMKRHTWDQTKPIGPWIIAIARNKMIDEIRRRGRRPEVPIDGLLEILEAPGQDDAINAYDAARVLDGLTGRARDIVKSIAIDGQSAREVAGRLGMSEVAVRVQLHRSLKSLADTYQQKPNP
ncbi:MAG TPA: sigma-70 family RNA polymerase sigma factor [Hyphomicrobium sp.]|nr:sigma-70 family RNA polymerase sigma factor [Hyphomicrobium sp.]